MDVGILGLLIEEYAGERVNAALAAVNGYQGRARLCNENAERVRKKIKKMIGPAEAWGGWGSENK